MKILLTFGKIDFDTLRAGWSGDALALSTEIHEILSRGKYLYKVCNDQEVFDVAPSDQARLAELKQKVSDEKWFNQLSVDLSKYQFARQVIFW